MFVYDENGVAHEKEAVDVAECIARLGWTTEPPVLMDTAKDGSKKGSKKSTVEETGND